MCQQLNCLLRISGAHKLLAMPSKNLSTTQEQDAARLKAKFIEWQADRKAKGLPHSQEAVSADMGFGQSAFTQYINGKIPLNIESASKFAQLLECKVEEFSPELASRIADISSRTAAKVNVEVLAKGDLFHAPSEEDIDVFNDFLLLIGDDRQEAIDLIRRRAKQARAYSAPVFDKITGKTKATEGAAAKPRKSNASVAITARLRQRSLTGPDSDEEG